MDTVTVRAGGWGFAEKSSGRPFVPWGCNYYDPLTGWAPRLWEQFDPTRVGRQFDQMQAIGVNVVRVFTTITNLLLGPDRTNRDGLAKMQRMLEIADQHGIRVIWSGPSTWEGEPSWWQTAGPHELFIRAELIEAQAVTWRGVGEAMRGHPAVFAYDLQNEPFIPWQATPSLRERWDAWRRLKAPAAPAELPVPEKPLLLNWNGDFQRFREDLAVAYVARMVEAIREADHTHLITIGLHQKSAPFDWYPPDPYAAFPPDRLAPFLDYQSVHFYPHHVFHPNLYRDPLSSPAAMRETLWHARAVTRYVHTEEKPVVLQECGWYGGGAVFILHREQPALTEEQQTAWCSNLVEATKGDVNGWLFWPYRDTPSSLDSSRYSGLYNAEGGVKDWGRAFARMSPSITSAPCPRVPPTCLMKTPVRELTTDLERIKSFREEYLKAFREGEVVDFLPV